MPEIAGFGAIVWRDGVKIDNIPMLTFPPKSLRFDKAMEKEIAPRTHDVTMEFTMTWDNVAKWISVAKFIAMYRRRERKRQRRYQRQKRKGG